MMIIALLAAAAAAATPTAPSSPERQLVRQATATVRIISGARVDSATTPRDALVRQVKLESADGSRQALKLVEFP